MFFRKKKETDVDVLQKIKDRIAEDDKKNDELQTTSNTTTGGTDDDLLDDLETTTDNSDTTDDAIDDINKVVEQSIVANEDEQDSFESSLESDFLSDVFADDDATKANQQNDAGLEDNEDTADTNAEDLIDEENRQNGTNDGANDDQGEKMLGLDGKYYTEDDLTYMSVDRLRELGFLEEKSESNKPKENEANSVEDDLSGDLLGTDETNDDDDLTDDDTTTENQKEASETDEEYLNDVFVNDDASDYLENDEDDNNDEEDDEEVGAIDNITENDISEKAKEVAGNNKVKNVTQSNKPDNTIGLNTNSGYDTSTLQNHQSLQEGLKQHKNDIHNVDNVSFPVLPREDVKEEATHNVSISTDGKTAVSNHTKESVKGSITDLIENVKNQILHKRQARDIGYRTRGKTIEQFVEELIRPKLVEYLDANLDRLVKDAVDKEIQKIVAEVDTESV